ncbi:DUF1631 family protein [Zoogloea sp.]|uniref:DUF1631 family protein n=1 Tax=Zoogloea sp. TaxID=49181 RepID=UPI001416E7AA|nr:MAG: DUF1631 domain-containing protein [Zoogloea sp.]
MQSLKPAGPSPTTPANLLIAHCRQGFLAALGAAVEEVVQHPGWRTAFVNAAGECFDELCGGGRPGFESAKGLTASRISLVHDEDLDYSVELMNLDQRLHAFCERELAALNIRMRPLLSGVDAVPPEELPLGTEAVCRALRAFKDREGLSPVEALKLIPLLEPALGRHLCAFYRALEQRLSTAGVEPLRPRAVSRQPERVSWTNSAAARSSLPIHPVESLRLAVMARRQEMRGGRSSLDAGLAAALLDRVEAWLGERQRSGEGMSESLGTSELGALLSPGRAVAVEVIEAVCDYAAREGVLPAALRAVVAQLRIPLLRLALRSETLLAEPRHAALRLLDLIGNLGRTLAPDCSPELPVCRALLHLARELAKAPRIGEKDVEAALVNAEGLIEARRRHALERAATLAGEAGRLERREVALHQASRAIHLMLSPDDSAAARDFVEGYWVHVLAKAAYRYGTESPRWAARVQMANRLLSSTRAHPDAAARAELQAQMRALMAGLEDGLRWIGLSDEKVVEGLTTMRSLLAALIAGHPLPPPMRRPVAVPALTPVADVQNLWVLKHKQYFVGEQCLPPEWEEVEVGDPVAIGLPSGSVMRGFVALLGPQQHLILIADGDSQLVLAVTARALANLSEARCVLPYSLVDEAAIDRVINP